MEQLNLNKGDRFCLGLLIGVGLGSGLAMAILGARSYYWTGQDRELLIAGVVTLLVCVIPTIRFAGAEALTRFVGVGTLILGLSVIIDTAL